MPESDPFELVRVRTATGIETNVSRGAAEASSDLEILDEPAQVAFGKPRSATRAMSGRRHTKPYRDLTVSVLKAEIEKRNEVLPDEAKLPVSGNKPDLVKALEQADAAGAGTPDSAADDAADTEAVTESADETKEQNP